MKTIIELNNNKAREYFLKQESYSNIQMPAYFDFQPLLDELGKNGNLKGGLSFYA